MPNLNPNSTNYFHSYEPNTSDLTMAMQYDVLGRPILRTTLGPTAVDAFGRFRVSSPFTLFDSFQRYQDNQTFANYTANGGTTSHDSNASVINMTVDGTNGSTVYRETKKVFPYQPGKSLLVMETFCMAPTKTGLRQRIGYYDVRDGFYLEQADDNIYFVKRSNVSGTVVETRVAKENWNITPLDGTGADKIVLNLNSSQILFTNIEWLGVGSVLMGFVINGQLIPCHRFDHANQPGVTTTYTGTACLPLRYEIENTAATGDSDTLKCICQTVISEGGYELEGRPLVIGHNISTPRTTSAQQNGVILPMISIRLKANREGAVVIPTNFSFAPITAANYEYYIIQEAITTGGTWTSAGTVSSVEYNLTPTSYSNGRLLDQGYVIATNQSTISPQLMGFPFKYQLERNSFTGQRYEFLIATKTTTNSTSQAYSIGWEEHT